MSVMTAGEQKRRAGSARGRRLVTAVPGQPNVMAGPWPGAGERHDGTVAGERRGRAAPGERHGRTAHGTPGQAPRPGAAGTVGSPPSRARTEAALPLEAGSRPVRIRVRLTRRGRIVVAGLITASMVLVAALAWLAGTARADAAGSGVPSSAVYHSLRSVVVLPGQSLWSIATQYEPGSDPRNVIQEIIDLNALSGTSVQPGEHLWLPRG
jgi:hypothetical protein